MKHILIIAGTRPEVLKLAPLYTKLKSYNRFKVTFCLSGQHKELLTGLIELFNITPEINLEVMTSGQSLASLTSKIIEKFDTVLKEQKPDAVIVHGDTTTAMAASLAAFYNQIKIVHVEAGLRTNNLLAPWPEEANRQIIGRLASLHLCPTDFAKETLEKENPSSKKIFVTGNTIIDTLLSVHKNLDESELRVELKRNYKVDVEESFILVTGHRRENFGEGFKRIFESLLHISEKTKLNIIYPVHLNPAVKEMAHEILGASPKIYLIPPLDYKKFVFLMSKSFLILTDSGGVQEEALSFNKNILVMRETTERPEGLTTGLVHLVGSSTDKIISSVNKIMSSSGLITVSNPYGDGKASERIIKILESEV